MSAAPLPPGSTLGIVGVGQLGQMLAVAAARLGFRVRTFGPDEDPPAARVAQAHMAAPYEDEEALRRFAGCDDAATYEFENIPPRSVAVLQDHVPVRPGAEVLAVCQDRLEEKRFLSSLGIPVAPHAPVDHPGGAARRECRGRTRSAFPRAGPGRRPEPRRRDARARGPGGPRR